jgi:hypothetical protein
MSHPALAGTGDVMRPLAISVLGLTAAGLVTGWWLWPRARAERQLGTPQTSPAVENSPTPAQIPSRLAVLELQVNDALGTRIRSGGPLLFSVALIGTSSTRALRIGEAGRAWSVDLRFETVDGRPAGLKVEPLGDPAVIPRGRESRAPPPASSEPDGKTVVDDSRIHRVEFGLSPDESARLAPGTYNLRVVLPLPSAPEGVKMLASNAVSVTVELPASGERAPAEQEKMRLQAAARFYNHAKKWEDAHRVALQLVERQDAGTTAYLLLGDALNGLRRDDEALAAYQEALAALPKETKEAPVYLLTRIEQVRERLESRTRTR